MHFHQKEHTVIQHNSVTNVCDACLHGSDYLCCLHVLPSSRAFPLLPSALLPRASHLHSGELQALYEEESNEGLREKKMDRVRNI